MLKKIVLYFLIAPACLGFLPSLQCSQNASVPHTKKGQKSYYRNLVAKNPAYSQVSFPKNTKNKHVSFKLL